MGFYLDYLHDVFSRKKILFIVVWIMKHIDSGHIIIMILKCYHEQSMKKITIKKHVTLFYFLDVSVLYQRKSMMQDLLNQKMNVTYLQKLNHRNQQQLLLSLYRKL
jgi:hypothetical protein